MKVVRESQTNRNIAYDIVKISFFSNGFADLTEWIGFHRVSCARDNHPALYPETYERVQDWRSHRNTNGQIENISHKGSDYNFDHAPFHQIKPLRQDILVSNCPRWRLPIPGGSIPENLRAAGPQTAFMRKLAP